MKLLVTGATGFLGWRCCVLLAERGHEVVATGRPGGRRRVSSKNLATVALDAGDPRVRGLVAGSAAVLHFAGVPDPARASADPARAVRENVGTTLNLLEACAEHGAGLIYPSTVRAAAEKPPDPYALSKRLGEELCQMHRAAATAVRLTSVFGPGQVAWEGATGAIAVFAARALEGAPIVIPGDPERARDFTYVDDVVGALETIVSERRWNLCLTVASGVETALVSAAELVREAVGSSSPIETPGGTLPLGENKSYGSAPGDPRLHFPTRPLEEGIRLYVNWLRGHPAAEGRS
ncbi:MAG TPA: NAD-dependent epimerase/dehydratase family protein [Solirubrobacterales bacterium]|nr:NAD-dependent epimerase/dehydratase family protein [Solirubrobacterales bacterium]